MKLKKLVALTFLLLATFFVAKFIYKKFFFKEKKLPFKTTTPMSKNISQIIYSSGLLRVKGHIKIGSLVSGVIEELFVQENDIVKKGQLLAKINNGKKDTDVKIAKGRLLKAESELEYASKYFKRQKELFKSNQISQNFFDQVTKNYKNAKAELQISQADLQKKEIEYQNTKIIAPDEGMIISVGITKGERITTDLDATVLFKIAKDITQMEAKLDIDEGDIGQIKNGLKVRFKVDTYPEKKFYGKITNVSFSPKKKHNIQIYEAIASVKNKNKLLRPGMTVEAKLVTNKKQNCFVIPNQAFQINPQILEKIAKSLEFKFSPIPRKKRKSIKKNHSKITAIKFIWCYQKKKFVEKAVEIGITDDTYYEVISGLKQTDKIIIDVEEPNEMEQIYKKWFNKGL